jgi:ATP-binding cassette, subfamily C, bacterial PrsD
MESYKNSGSATHCEAADPVGDALRESRRRLIGIAGFSGVVNLLNLSGSLYMLQVYDR